MIQITDNIKYNFSFIKKGNIALTASELGSYLLHGNYLSKYCFYHINNKIIEINSFSIDSNNINLYIKYKIT